MKFFKNLSGIEWLVIAAIIFIVVGLAVKLPGDIQKVKTAVGEYNDEQSADERTGFDGWVKLTGNEKNLTFEEWRSLKRDGLLK